MKNCPVCGYKKPAQPPKLTDTHNRILAFCRVPKMAGEIAVHLCMKETNLVYKHLRLLQRLDVLEKQPTGSGVSCYFVATGKPIAWEPEFMSYRPQVMGVAL